MANNEELSPAKESLNRLQTLGVDLSRVDVGDYPEVLYHLRKVYAVIRDRVPESEA